MDQTRLRPAGVCTGRSRSDTVGPIVGTVARIKINRLAINASAPLINDSSHFVHATHAEFITGSAACSATQRPSHSRRVAVWRWSFCSGSNLSVLFEVRESSINCCQISINSPLSVARGRKETVKKTKEKAFLYIM